MRWFNRRDEVPTCVRSLVASIDDDGTGVGEHNECEEGNNEDRWTEDV